MLENYNRQNLLAATVCLTHAHINQSCFPYQKNVPETFNINIFTYFLKQTTHNMMLKIISIFLILFSIGSGFQIKNRQKNIKLAGNKSALCQDIEA